jgi:hypothetical protein
MTDIKSVYSYSIFSFVADELRGTSIPVGVALWSSEPKDIRIRLVRQDEHVKGLKVGSYPYLQLINEQLSGWIKTGNLPYSSGDVSATSEDWWKHLSQLLVHKVRLSEPHAISCQDSEQEVDLLFEALVRPERDEKEKTDNIDRALSKSLGSLSRRFLKGCVPGFKGRDVPVKRYAADERHLVVLDGVNLAAVSAEMDSDALVSRLQRIREGRDDAKTRKITAVVGYLASPHGLNGEATLVEWIRKKGKAITFDLTRQKQDFVHTVEGELERLTTESVKKPLFD